MEIIVKVPGSCGELAEGRIAGIDFHITCPIDLYTTVEIKSNKRLQGIKFSNNLANSIKTQKAITETLEYLGLERNELNLELELKSELSVAKGMASSTADITATIIALLLSLGKEVDLAVVKELALAVDPTDGVFMPGIVAFDHFQGRIKIPFGEIDSIPLLVFDTGKEIDTVKFSQRTDLTGLRRAEESNIRQAYKLIKTGIKKNDWQLIARGTTISSLANQSILFKPYLKDLISLVEKKEDVLGVNIAHTGSLIGVLLKKDADRRKILKKIQAALPKLNYLLTTRIINGGAKIQINQEGLI